MTDGSEEYQQVDQSMKLLICQICEDSSGDVLQCVSCFLYLHAVCADMASDHLLCQKCQTQIQNQPTTRSNRRKLMILD